MIGSFLNGNNRSRHEKYCVLDEREDGENHTMQCQCYIHLSRKQSKENTFKNTLGWDVNIDYCEKKKQIIFCTKSNEQ